MTTITLPRAVVEQALEALEQDNPSGRTATITALRAALARQAEPVEPVAWRVRRNDGQYELYFVKASAERAAECYIKRPQVEPLYTTQPQHPDTDCHTQGICQRSGYGIGQQAEPVEPESCAWHQDGDSDSGVYGTSCGRYFNLDDGTPEDNKMHWCCYCGKTLAQELITEDGND